MTRTRRLVLGSAIALAAAAGVASCDLGPGEPGELMVTLTTPNVGDAGILFTITGTVTGVTATSTSHRLFWRLTDGRAHVLVFGNIQSGPLVTVAVPDVDAVAGYSAVVLDVTDRDNQVRDSFAGYDVAFGKVK